MQPLCGDIAMGNDFIASVVMPSSMPDPGVFKTFISGHELFGQEACFFNSALRVRNGFAGNATLTIYLRLYLIKRDRAADMTPLPKTSDGTPVTVIPWGEPTSTGVAYDFDAFVQGVKREAEQFWDNTNFCLMPPPDYRALEYPDGNRTVRPNIDCRFAIVWADGPGDAHAVIDCFCPTGGTFFSLTWCTRQRVRSADSGPATT
jgi:hypothetical protein